MIGPYFTHYPGCYYGSPVTDSDLKYGMPNAYSYSTEGNVWWFGIKIPSANAESTILNDGSQIAFTGLIDDVNAVNPTFGGQTFSLVINKSAYDTASGEMDQASVTVNFAIKVSDLLKGTLVAEDGSIEALPVLPVPYDKLETRVYDTIVVAAEEEGQWGAGGESLYLVHEVFAKSTGAFVIYVTDLNVKTAARLPITDLPGFTLTEYGSVVKDGVFAFSWQVPEAAAGTTFYVGIKVSDTLPDASVEALAEQTEYTGVWKIIVTDRAQFYASYNEFRLDAPEVYKRFEYKDIGSHLSKWQVKGAALPSPAESEMLMVGEGFSVELEQEGLLARIIPQPELVDKDGKALSSVKSTLQPWARTAKNIALPSENPVWAVLDRSNAMVDYGYYPCYSWVVPDDAEEGDVFVVGLEASTAYNGVATNYVALFKVIVVTTAPSSDNGGTEQLIPEEEESSFSIIGLMIGMMMIIGYFAATYYILLLMGVPFESLLDINTYLPDWLANLF